LDAIFDPNVQSNRDLSDEVRVDLAQNVDPNYPTTELFSVTADSTGVTGTTDKRRLGPSAVVDSLQATDSGTDPTTNGEITNNNDTIKVKTGGTVAELGQKGATEAEKRLLANQIGTYY
jgi:hypothetical protein